MMKPEFWERYLRDVSTCNFCVIKLGITLIPAEFTHARFSRIADGPDEVHMSQLGKLTIQDLVALGYERHNEYRNRNDRQNYKQNF